MTYRRTLTRASSFARRSGFARAQTIIRAYVRFASETATFRVGDYCDEPRRRFAAPSRGRAERGSRDTSEFRASRTRSPAATYARKTKTTATITAKTVSIFAAGETVAVVVVVGQVTASALMMLSGL